MTAAMSPTFHLCEPIAPALVFQGTFSALLAKGTTRLSVLLLCCAAGCCLFACLFVFFLGDQLKYSVGSHRKRLVPGVKCHLVDSHNLVAKKASDPACD